MLVNTKVYNRTRERYYKLRSPNVSNPEKSVTILLKYILYVPDPCIKEYLHLRSKSVLLCYISVNTATYFGTKHP